MIKNKHWLIRQMKRGATIRRGNFSGFRLIAPGDAKDSTGSSILPRIVTELEDDGVIVKVDDQSKVGAEWRIAEGSKEQE